jgi:hypothetical protein
MKYVSILTVALVICVGMIFGCQSKESKAGNFKEQLFYFKDHQTGLCFAAASAGYQGAMATVPCDKVEHLLK